jgi:ribosomal protein L22
MSGEKTENVDAEGAGPEKAEVDTAKAKAATGKSKAKAKAKADAPEPKPKKPRTRKAPKAEAEKKVEDPPVEVEAKPARSRAAAATAPPLVRARARYVRSSARKARLVCDTIRGKTVDDARAILAMTPRHVARDWSKLLESAVANAENNHELVGDDLRIASVHADEGPTLKRFQPRAMGRASRIRKRTSHLSITLTPKG